jgi:hypothetical protein
MRYHHDNARAMWPDETYAIVPQPERLPLIGQSDCSDKAQLSKLQ